MKRTVPFAMLACVAIAATPAFAQDVVKLAARQRGNRDTAVPHPGTMGVIALS